MIEKEKNGNEIEEEEEESKKGKKEEEMKEWKLVASYSRGKSLDTIVP